MVLNMNRLKIKQKKVISVTFLLVLTLSSILTVFPSNFSNSVDFNENSKPNKVLTLLSAQIGEDPWWNVSYQWRQCINITNPGDYNLTNNFISIRFDYATLRDNYNMDPNLYDVRIVENNVVRDYYVKKDFPSTDQATIWFETNATLGESEYDTYMYWGNASINYRGNNHISYDPSGTSWWRFEEGSGGYDSVVDDSLDYADAHLYGTSSSYYPDYDPDAAVGSFSLSFDGSHDFVYIEDSLHYTEPNEISAVTVSCWFKTSFSSGGNWDNWAFFDFDRSEYFNFFITGSGNIGFASSATGYSGQNDFFGSVSGLNDGEWHFACVVYDGIDKYIYVDDFSADVWSNAMGGRAFGTGRDRWGFFGDGSEAAAENGNRNNYYYDGNIDEIRYFEYAVSPDEIQWLSNYYDVDTELLPVTERAAAVTIVVEDVDGRRVPGAEVSLWDNSTHILEIGGTPYTDYTGSDGTVSFTKVPFGFYNITANYTLNSGLYEQVVYDSRDLPGGDVEFKGLVVSTTINAELWTIDFEVDDWDGDPLDYGFVKVGNAIDYVLETLILDSEGKTTFRWLNTTSYNYTVYYDNIDYTIENPTKLNESKITRAGPPPPLLEYVKVDMAKLEIIVLDETETILVDGVTVRLTINGTNDIVTKLKTKEDGTAYGRTNSELIFWYKRGVTYNITLWIVSAQFNFKLNYSDQPFNPNKAPQPEYNYTLTSASTIIFEIALNFQDYITRLENATLVGGNIVSRGQTMAFSVYFSFSDNGLAGPWTADDGSSSLLTCFIKSIELGYPTLYQKDMTPLGNGNFTVDIDSTLFSAGYYGKSYLAVISGQKEGYKKADDLSFIFTITPIPTGMTLHNYTTLSLLPTNEVSQYYNEIINVTLRYYDANLDSSLIAEIFTFDWDYGSGSVNPDPMNPGYYTIEIDTGDATNVGKYRIEVTVGRENYSKIDNFGFYLNILSRPTTINGEEGILYLSQDIYIFKELNFMFEYEDAMSSNYISNLDEMSYLLQKLDENGVPIPGTSEIGTLNEGIDVFILDLDTESREDGEYSIIVTLNKMNWDLKIAIISLTIMKREFAIDLPEPPFVGSKIEVASGASLSFTLTLTDPNNETYPNAPIRGANVYLTIGNRNFSIADGDITDNNDGTYTIITTAIADAFFMPQTFTATLTIEKQYFSTSSTGITIVVKMQEIFGIPTFYFLMIVGAVVAVAGSLVTYRTIQRARIPTFVKKAREMKKNIKGKKSISESLLYPTKDEYIVKKLGTKWEEIGLSLDDLMGITGKKKKKLPEVREEFKGGVD